MKWYCSSSLCFNNFRTLDADGKKLTYYRLPRDVNLQSKYIKIFKTSGMNWKKGHICSAHWSKGYREDTSDLPDIPVPADQLLKLKEKLERSKKAYTSSNKTPERTRKRILYKSLIKKYRAAVALSSSKKLKARRKLSIII